MRFVSLSSFEAGAENLLFRGCVDSGQNQIGKNMVEEITLLIFVIDFGAFQRRLWRLAKVTHLWNSLVGSPFSPIRY
jgi:hypothetical protein